MHTHCGWRFASSLRSFATALLLLLPLLLSAEPEGGLLFPHNKGDFGSRGALRLPSSGLLDANGGVKVSFGLALWDPSFFGHILSISDTVRFTMELVYSPRPADEDSGDIYLSLNKEPTGLSISLSRADLRRDSWHVVELEIHSQTICVTIRGIKKCHGALRIAQPEAVRLDFGSVPDRMDTPPMTIRDIEVTARGTDGSPGPMLRWALNEAEGTAAHDATGSYPGETSETLWLAAFAQGWVRQASFQAGPLWQMAFDHRTSTLYAVGKTSIVRFSLLSGILREIPCKNPRPNPDGTMKVVFNEVRGALCAYHTGLGQVSWFDESTELWSAIDTSSDHDQHFYAHATIVNREGDMYAVGGYGWYKTRNEVHRYDEVSRQWRPVEMAGTEFPSPRMGPVVAAGPDSDSWYVFGNTGNRSGEQSAGFYELHDLWLLNLRTATWRKTFDTLNVPAAFEAWGMARMPGSNEIVVIGREPEPPHTLRFFAFCPDTNVVRELPPMANAAAPSVAYADFDPRIGQFVVVATIVRSAVDATIEIYTLRAGVQPLAAGISDSEGGHPYVWLLAVAVVGALAVGVSRRLMRVRKSQPVRTAGAQPDGDTRHRVAAPPTGTSIRIFGPFSVTDARGVDRTAEFSPKILELFLLILTHSRPDSSGGQGISSERLAEVMWPHSTRESAKDSRGVAIKTLRDLAEEIGGIMVRHNGLGYSIQLKDGASVDYFDALAALGGIGASEPGMREGAIRRLFKVMERGEILSDRQYPWLGEVRSKFEKAITSALIERLSDAYNSTDFPLWGQVADYLLQKDHLNEAALRVKLHLLSAEGQHGEVVEAYNTFARSYLSTFNTPFPRALRDLLN